VSAYIDTYRGRFGVEPICSVLGVSASAYYHRKSGARSQRVVDDERLLALIRELQLANYEAYGSRETWLALRRAGHEVGRDRVARLMRGAGIRGAKGRTKRWQTTQPELVRRLPDLVERRFEAAGPDELWVADFTYLRSWQGVVFLSFVIDVFSRRVVGWQFASNAHSPSYVTSHGAPGSARPPMTRAAQARNAARLLRHELAKALADRIEQRGAEEGLPDVDECLVPLTAREAAAIGADPGAIFPRSLAKKAERCLEAPIETLIERGITILTGIAPSPTPPQACAATTNATTAPATLTASAATQSP
jgi:hypothetical protein